MSGELEALDDGEKVDRDCSDSDSGSLISEYFSVLIVTPLLGEFSVLTLIPHPGERMKSIPKESLCSILTC